MDSGALITLQDWASIQYVTDNSVWVEYTERNYASWYNYAKETRHLNLKEDEIILVRGIVKATRWSSTSFLNKGETFQLNYSAGTPYFNIEVETTDEATDTGSPLSRPSSDYLTGDAATAHVAKDDALEAKNTIFIVPYQVEYRYSLVFRVPKVIKAGAGPHELPPKDGSQSDDQIGRAHV